MVGTLDITIIQFKLEQRNSSRSECVHNHVQYKGSIQSETQSN